MWGDLGELIGNKRVKRGGSLRFGSNLELVPNSIPENLEFFPVFARHHSCSLLPCLVVGGVFMKEKASEIRTSRDVWVLLTVVISLTIVVLMTTY